MTAEKEPANGYPSVNDVYVLKKDLPNIKKGTEFIIKDDLRGNLYIMAINQASFPLEGIENFKEWFEQLEKKMWTPKIGETYYYITDYLGIGYKQREDKEGEDWADGMFDETKLELGNCFEREIQVRDCLELYIKPAFKNCQQNQKDGGVG